VQVPPVDNASPVSPSQVLYRAEMRRGDEHLSMRWTLRRWSTERFEMRAADALGRSLWRIEVAGRAGIFTDSRSDVSCRFDAAESLVVGEVPLAIPVGAWPRALEGLLPVPLPADGERRSGNDSDFDFLDGSGGHWTGRITAGRLSEWDLERDGKHQVAARIGGELVRAETESGLAVEWRAIAREPLRSGPPAAAPSVDDIEECRDADLP